MTQQDLSYKRYTILCWRDDESIALDAHSEEEGMKKFNMLVSETIQLDKKQWYVSLEEFTHLKQEVKNIGWVPVCTNWRTIAQKGTYSMYASETNRKADEKIKSFMENPV